MAEEIALSVAGWVASPIVSRLLNEGFSFLRDAGIKDKLENAQTAILLQFYLVIEAAEKNNELKTELKSWLRKLKDAMYEAEDMLDLCKYQLLEEKVRDLNSDSTPTIFGKYVGNLKRGLSSAISPQNKELRESLIKLERVAADAKKFRELTGLHAGNNTSNDSTSGRRPNVTTSLPPPHQVFGRDEERDEIINKYLLDASEASESEMDRVRRRGYSVVAIVGIGGAGKTTLAQLVYHDQSVVDYFGIKMWVCLSRKLDVFRLTREMIESASKKDCPLLENLDALQMNLIDIIKSKKVLLVLDDVWCYKSDDAAKWEQLLAPFSSGGMGSKILMTTRPENMPNMPVALRPLEIKLKDLEEDEFLSLFSYHAFGGIKLSEPYKQEELEKIGKQIVQKLAKSPLAAKAVGAQLSKRLEANFWRSALNQDNLSDTTKVLLWSYQRLDGPLQRCFSYLSLFPKGQRFEEERIVHLWMAEGFLDSSDDSKRIEDIGSDFFTELVSGSFLQLVEETQYTKYYGMHDLFHDLAEKVLKEDCLRIEDDKVKDIPSTIRHLYVSSEFMRKASMSFHKPRNLRTLIVFGRLNMSDSDLLSAAIDKFKKLRVLDLSLWSIKALPDSVSSLKYLRYLDLSGTYVVELPVSFDKLHHLQLLKLPSECFTFTLPSSVANMFNLRHLDASHWTHVKLPYLGRLTSLQRLLCFTVDEKSGHDIGQLKNLNELRGSLEILRLENVGGKDKATEANLRYKKHLDTLRLQWTSDDDPNDRTNLDMEVLEGLEPPPNLTKLEIRGCKSRRCPSWLAREGCLENLRSLTFDGTSFEDLPTIGKLFPRCEDLKIWQLPNLMMLPLLPEGLKALVIKSCPLLVFVSEEELQKSEDIKKSITTIARSSQVSTAFKLTMEERQIVGCPRNVVEEGCLDVKKLLESEKVDIPEDFQTFASEEMLRQLNGLQLWQAYICCQEQRLEAIFRRREKNELIVPPSLQSLVIESINITDRALSRCLGMLTSLTTLSLRGINTITAVPTDNLMALRDLEVVDCYSLESLGDLHALLSLKSLCIYSCPCLELEMMEGESGGTSADRVILPPALRSPDAKRFVIRCLPNLVNLELRKLSSLASLSLSGLTSLRTLAITDCPALSALNCSLESSRTEDVPKLTSVEELRISSCATLSMLLSGSSKCLAGLSRLDYICCPEAYFHEESFNCLTSLKTLHLYECKFQSLPTSLKSMSSLETLYLTRCPHISSLSDLPNSLRHLGLEGCHLISSLPVRLPESLRMIEISNCPDLKERCQEPKGEDWPKIAHITYRSILGETRLQLNF